MISGFLVGTVQEKERTTVDENSRARSAHSPILGTGEPGSGVLRKDRPERLCR